MSTANTAERLDAAIAEFFSSWDMFTTVLAIILGVVLIYPLLTRRESDTHPFLLARQAQVAPVRQPGHSAVYRAIDLPHGYPLRSGLGVKDPGAPRWTAGRAGDLRDVWRSAARGAVKDDGTLTGEKGKILTVLGRDKVTEHELDDLTLGINVVGQYVKRNNGQSVAVCLSNSVELLSAIFAGSFYGFSTTLIPYGLPQDKLNSLLSKTSADHVIAEAGTLDLDAMQATSQSIKNVIWVANSSSQHMEWSANAPSGLSVASWHELVQKNHRSTNSEVLPLDLDSQVPPVSIFYPAANGGYDLVKYTSGNLISGTAGLQATLLRAYKLSPSDTVHATTSLTDSYTLCWILAALYSNASVSLNSVAGDNVDLIQATALSRPTVVIASPSTVQAYLEHPTTKLPSGLSKYVSKRTLQAGNLPAKSAGTLASSLASLRVLLIPQSTNLPAKTRLSSSTLHTLRSHLQSRIGYALTTPLVAGAITQTNILDYRDKGARVCLGAPLSSVEVHVSGDEEIMDTHTPQGKITVRGPAVVGGKITLDVEGQVDEDHTLLLP
ncbi:hypothetical protein A1O3_00338 [Capronia epimyces CBS 606.96]|uniref:AMP-dependent synthetase/ligase domain-containing protein n=1 Tax=Capronia epimyces CBS 606.96 TaxID=1182542 RepID=W9YGV9_9EURO|nr:uncharacterized protein A1O3_00338 [Capronia epimyces CBS 606.96]EXJ91788.1 hypothetical protein A1O3_00338 [Capronia epimyces CBS 606.96]